MMGVQPPRQEKLFYPAVSLEQRVRRDHPLRQIAQTIDVDFLYAAVADRYGTNGHVSVPPPVILKLMLLLVLYNVRSERELMATLPERLDWLWFVGVDLDTAIPDHNHSVLSKARRLWGVAVFQGVFERIVGDCVAAGLVDGRKLFVDASLIEADASNASVVDTQSLKRYLNTRYRVLEARLTFGPGYRIYFGRDGESIIVLLTGGGKASQARDIRRAQGFWRDYVEAQRHGKAK